jgi:RNA polymerase sigma-70 factor (ECF subfamily)
VSGLGQEDLAAANKDDEDEKIVARVCAGQVDAFAIIMRRYNQRLYRTARAILRDDSEAEDVVQETYFRAFAHLPSFRHEAKLGTWLTRIAVNEACARLRRCRRIREVEAPIDMPVVTPEECAGNDELRRALEAAIDALPAPLRIVFVLRSVDGLDTGETAAILGISVASTKVRLHRARAALRHSLSPRFEAMSREAFTFLGMRCDRIVAAVMGVLARS